MNLNIVKFDQWSHLNTGQIFSRVKFDQTMGHQGPRDQTDRRGLSGSPTHSARPARAQAAAASAAKAEAERAALAREVIVFRHSLPPHMLLPITQQARLLAAWVVAELEGREGVWRRGESGPNPSRSLPRVS